MNEWITLAGLVGGIGFLTAASWKWSLPLRFSAFVIAFGALAGAAAGWLMNRLALPWPGILLGVPAAQLAVYIATIAYRFYRDPERTAPECASSIASPADGKVIYIRKLPANGVLRCDKQGAALILDELKNTPLAAQELWQIGISMVFTDVHVNRAPVSGKIALAHHRPGRFLSLRLPEAVNLNERQTLLFDNGRFQVAIVQIASRLVRRIQPYVQQGQTVAIAQRIGMIKFGSQVDVFLPVQAAPTLVVSVGDQLVAGETVIASSVL